MLLEVYSLFDTALRVHTTSIFTNVDVFKRGLSRLLSNPDSDFSKFPGQYQIFKVAHFDDATGFYEPFVEFESLGLLSDYVEVKDV